MPERVFGASRIPIADARGASRGKPPTLPDRDPRLLAELHPGEGLLWADRPVRAPHGGVRLITRVMGVFFLLFSVVWFGVLVAVFTGAWQGQGGWNLIVPAVAGAAGLMPLGMGVMLILISRPGRWAPAKYLYAITTERCLIWTPSGLRSTEVRSIRPEAMNALDRVERADGSGDLILMRTAQGVPASVGPGANLSHAPVAGSVPTPHGFFAIGEVAKVERLVRETYGIGITDP